MATIITSVMAASLCLVLAQLPDTSFPTAGRVHLSSSVSPEIARPGESVTLSVEITPKKDVRLFAPGAKDFTAVALMLTVPKGFALGKPRYPIPERQSVPGVKKPVFVYDGRIDLQQSITIARDARPGDTLTITGMVTYQSCDDTVTYRRAALPVSFTVKIG